MENWAPGIGMAKGQGLLPTFMAPQEGADDIRPGISVVSQQSD
jgi:hypothetical protein